MITPVNVAPDSSPAKLASNRAPSSWPPSAKDGRDMEVTRPARACERYASGLGLLVGRLWYAAVSAGAPTLALEERMPATLRVFSDFV